MEELKVELFRFRFCYSTSLTSVDSWIEGSQAVYYTHQAKNSTESEQIRKQKEEGSCSTKYKDNQ